MSSRLPVVTGEELIKALRKIGYEEVRRKGSHVRLRCPSDSRRRPTTVPVHGSKPVRRGTLLAILDDAGLTVEELRDLLR